MGRHPRKTAWLSGREQRRHAQRRDAHRFHHQLRERRCKLGPARFFFPRPNGCCAICSAHLALRDATSSLPALAQLHFLLILPRFPNLVSGWIKCHFSLQTSTCGKLSKCLSIKHWVIVPGLSAQLSCCSVNIFVQYGPRHCPLLHLPLFL